VRIAVVMTLDGILAAQLAAEDINSAGGIHGRPIELVVIEESHSDAPRQAIATAERLTADPRVLAVIGHRGSGGSLAASQVYNAEHLPQIAPTSSAPLYTEAGPYSFRLVASDIHQAEFIARRVAAMTPVPRIAVLYVNDDYGRAFHDLLQAELTGAGREPVYSAPYLDGETQLAERRRELLKSIGTARADLLLWIGRSRELVQLRSELRSALPRLLVLGSDAMADGTYAGRPEFAGDRIVRFVDIVARAAALRGFTGRHAARGGDGLTDEAPLTYDAVGLVATALRQGATDRESIRNYLDSLSLGGGGYAGISGEIRFDADGDARPSYFLLQLTSNGWRGTE
jgi:branched-chain amino acid transport system substrate-binding protein